MSTAIATITFRTKNPGYPGRLYGKNVDPAQCVLQARRQRLHIPVPPVMRGHANPRPVDQEHVRPGRSTNSVKKDIQSRPRRSQSGCRKTKKATGPSGRHRENAERLSKSEREPNQNLQSPRPSDEALTKNRAAAEQDRRNPSPIGEGDGKMLVDMEKKLLQDGSIFTNPSIYARWHGEL